MIDKLEQLKTRYAEVQKIASDPEIFKDQKRYREIMQECNGLAEIVDAYARATEQPDLQGRAHRRTSRR